MKYHFSEREKEEISRNPWLTIREKKVFESYFRGGLHIEDIAAELEISRSTIDRDLKSIREKASRQKNEA